MALIFLFQNKSLKGGDVGHVCCALSSSRFAVERINVVGGPPTLSTKFALEPGYPSNKSAHHSKATVQGFRINLLLVFTGTLVMRYIEYRALNNRPFCITRRNYILL